MNTRKLIPVIRVSTRDQAENGVSLEAQADRLRKWADLNGYEWTDPVELPGVSGKSAKAKTAIDEAIRRLRPGSGDAIAAYSLSRLSRSTRNLMDTADILQKMGCNLVSLTESLDTSSATGKLVFRILSVLAEFERDIISERTTTALRHKKANGEKTGGKIPYGFNVNGGQLIPNPEEQRAITSIRELRSADCSLGEICEWLRQEGIPTKTGKSWHPSTVAGILKRQ